MGRFALLIVLVALPTRSVMADGPIVSWGPTSYFGNNPMEDLTPPPGQFQAIAAGSWFSLGLKTNGEIVGWGCGDGENYGYPCVLYDDGQATPPPGQFKAIAAGGHHGLALTIGGEIVGWGSNDYGQLDNIPSGQFQAISWGLSHGLGLTIGGSIVCWGDDDECQDTPTSGQFQAISAGDHHSLGLTTDGQIVGWGTYGVGNWWETWTALTMDGEIVGWGSNYNGEFDTPPGQFKAISAGDDHSVALTMDGQIVAWGDNNWGQLNYIPGGRFQAISAGPRDTLALTIGGEIVGWGYNSYDNLSAIPTGQFQAIAIGGDHMLAIAGPTAPVVPDPCAFDGDAVCTTGDLDALYAAFNTTDALFDLTLDGVVDAADLDEWLSLAATENGYESPYLRGDINLDRKVALYDYGFLAFSFDPLGTHGPYLWYQGNSDGDDDVDLSDYNALTANFSASGYGAAAVPEPCTAVIALMGMLLISVFGRLPVLK